MTTEMILLLAMSIYGAIQAMLTGRLEELRQIHRNFSETYYLFSAIILALAALDSFGGWSMQGAVVYAAGRLLYLALSIKSLRSIRKWAWATSMAGITGCAAELIRSAVPPA
jgi:uncharacterized MAPEG superfamily protein